MKTDDLVTMLARGAAAVDAHATARRYTVGIGAGVCVAGLMMAMLLGPRHDLELAARLPMFWAKLAFVAALAAASVSLALRVARPGVSLGLAPLAVALPIVAMWALAVVVLGRSDGAEAGPLFFGRTWRTCPLLIALLSAPVFVGMVWVMRGMAPTNLRAAGAVVGFVSGAMAALVYSIHCPELGAPFLGFWYLLGVLIPTAVGALAGPRLLRW